MLRYPSKLNEGMSEYVRFTPQQYRSNRGNTAARPPGGGQSIMLYMPNSTPTVGNSNNWGRKDFPGPLGDLQRRLGSSLVDSIQGASIETGVDGIVDSFKRQFEGAVNTQNVTAAGKQFIMQSIPQQLMGSTAAQQLALSRGEIFNPNVELLYNNPELRNFSFTFDMIPTSPGEQRTVNEIVRSFKKWSSPKDLQNGMFEVPYVWQVDYMTGASNNQHMGLFKPAACTSVNVAHNTQTEMHVSHPDGAPITTTIQLTFREVDVITRDDHDQGGQGF